MYKMKMNHARALLKTINNFSFFFIFIYVLYVCAKRNDFESGMMKIANMCHHIHGNNKNKNQWGISIKRMEKRQ